MDNEKIVLIGFMCSGKTSVGSSLSKYIKKSFIDLDLEIARYKEQTIEEIFTIEGEKAFREAESEFAFLLQNAKECVISTGGGVVEREETMESLIKGAKVIYLDANKETIIENYNNDDIKRPLLGDSNISEKVDELLEGRQELYKKYATITVDVNNCSIEDVVKKIIKELGYEDKSN